MPSRLPLLAGAANLLLAMLWWAAWSIDARWRLFDLPQPTVPAGWMHAFLMQYQVLPAFLFAYLLAALPRWTNLPAPSRRHHALVAAGLLIGQLLTLASLAGSTRLLHTGVILTMSAWILGLALLARIVWRDGGRNWHAVSCTFASGFGLLGLALFTLYLHTLDARALFASIKIGSLALLLPVFFTACDREAPSSAEGKEPVWALGVFWALALVHLWLELIHGYAWLWIVDTPLAALTAWLLWRWRVTHAIASVRPWIRAGLAWLPLAFALYATQSAWYGATGDFALGRAPAHALFIGFFGSALVSIMARGTNNHQKPALAVAALLMVQVVTVVRVAAEFIPDMYPWHALAAAGWVIAFAVAGSVMLCSSSGPDRKGK